MSSSDSISGPLRVIAAIFGCLAALAAYAALTYFLIYYLPFAMTTQGYDDRFPHRVLDGFGSIIYICTVGPTYVALTFLALAGAAKEWLE